MFCPKCGNEMPDNAEFCMKCGTSIKDINSGTTSKNEDSKKKKDNALNKIKNNNKAKIICLIIAIVVVLGAVALIITTCANSEKAKAYDEGVAFIQNNNIKDAEDCFKKAEGYKDANIYLPSVTAADQLYNQNSPGDALTTVTEMLDKGNNLDTITKYTDRDSSKLACFIIGEVYYVNNNLSEADSYYKCVPLTYSFCGHSNYERRATIELVGKWNIHQTIQIRNRKTNYIHPGEVNYVETFNLNGTYNFPGFQKAYATDGSGVHCHDNPYIGTWMVDMSHDGSDGNYYYTRTANDNHSSNFIISSGQIHGDSFTGTKVT